MCPNPQVFWPEEADVGCIFDEHNKFNKKTYRCRVWQKPNDDYIDKVVNYSLIYTLY